jgi:hypothetical protein
MNAIKVSDTKVSPRLDPNLSARMWGWTSSFETHSQRKGSTGNGDIFDTHLMHARYEHEHSARKSCCVPHHTSKRSHVETCGPTNFAVIQLLWIRKEMGGLKGKLQHIACNLQLATCNLQLARVMLSGQSDVKQLGSSAKQLHFNAATVKHVSKHRSAHSRLGATQ